MANRNLKCCFQTVSYTSFGSTALLILRLIAGVAFMIHGWGKIQTPMSWMGSSAPVPGFLQLLAAVSEFGGGLAWILGLLTPLATLGILCTMTVALTTHIFVLGDPFVNPTGGHSFEPAAVYWGVGLLILAVGPGRFSLDRLFFGPRT